ncbi:Myosin-1 [Varanus komodoensis]|nr:Myosin-1 [Varanus komodoensis]
MQFSNPLCVEILYFCTLFKKLEAKNGGGEGKDSQKKNCIFHPESILDLKCEGCKSNIVLGPKPPVSGLTLQRRLLLCYRLKKGPPISLLDHARNEEQQLSVHRETRRAVAVAVGLQKNPFLLLSYSPGGWFPPSPQSTDGALPGLLRMASAGPPEPGTAGITLAPVAAWLSWLPCGPGVVLARAAAGQNLVVVVGVFCQGTGANQLGGHPNGTAWEHSPGNGEGEPGGASTNKALLSNGPHPKTGQAGALATTPEAGGSVPEPTAKHNHFGRPPALTSLPHLQSITSPWHGGAKKEVMLQSAATSLSHHDGSRTFFRGNAPCRSPAVPVPAHGRLGDSPFQGSGAAVWHLRLGSARSTCAVHMLLQPSKPACS